MSETTFHPEVFGKYFLVDRIATGGMAEIFKAKTFSHGGFEHLLVIKRILAHLGNNEEFVEMFIDEAKVSVALQHANIIRIYDFGKIVDNYFIAMEWVDGKDARNILKKLSKQRKFLPVEFAAYVAHEACKGLEYAHRKTDLHGRPYGIVHRDVSPSNILVSYEGDVKIADFGIAKAESNAYDTKDGVLKGKFEYMSPEQAEGQEIDNRSDLFSLGIILHEMLTGRRLFKTGSDTQTLEKIKKGEIPLPSSLHSRVPPQLDLIVMKALARNRDDRYQSAKEMQEDLANFLLPQTSDQARLSLSRFMAETFAEEIGEERRRLDEGSKAAEELRKNTPMPDAWEGQTNSTISQGGAQTQRSIVPWVVMGGLGLAAIAALALVGGLFAMGTHAEQAKAEVQKPIVVQQAAPAKTKGDLAVLLLPEAKLTLDGNPLADGKPVGSFKVADLAPGDHAIHAEAEGYQPLDATVSVVAGETATFSRSLTAIPKPAAPPSTSSAKSDRNASKPSSGTSDTKPAAPAAAPAPSGPGKLTVAVVGGGWANVWVDGQKLSKTAPLSNYELPAGKHTIRVENPNTGIDHTETVTISSGGSSKVTAKPE